MESPNASPSPKIADLGTVGSRAPTVPSVSRLYARDHGCYLWDFENAHDSSRIILYAPNRKQTKECI